MASKTHRQPHRTQSAPHRQRRQGFTEYFSGYFLFILKNVIGWILILASLPIGAVVPGPGGIPLFILGFALVTFPGKRKLTSRLMRGRPIDLEGEIFTFVTAAVSVLVTLLLLWFISDRYQKLLEDYNLKAAQLVGICLLALVVTWLVTRLALNVLNWLLRAMPRIRRRIRPWLRRQGVNFLPPRRKRGGIQDSAGMLIISNDEIIELHERHHNRLKWLWAVSKPWLQRAVAVGITLAIFAWILRPIFAEWDRVKEPILQTSPFRFIIASVMFAIFLFAFRVLSWRRILQGLGNKLPLAAAARIWSTSELARYVPGVIWQVVGRVYLCKPYGVRGSICSVSQVLELAIFLLANVIVAVSCLLYFGIKNVEGAAQGWLFAACALVPLLVFLLHPRISYGIINSVMDRLGKPRIVRRLRGNELWALLGWNIIGLLWQSLAVYLLLENSLGLKIDWWWVMAGAYCLAWCAGFLAVWAPGGIGVRELVFVTAMHVLLPDEVKQHFGDAEVFAGFLAFLSVLLRLWTVAGELLLASFAYALDLRGAMGRADAPGRVGITGV